jgi:hypothetical protein
MNLILADPDPLTNARQIDIVETLRALLEGEHGMLRLSGTAGREEEAAGRTAEGRSIVTAANPELSIAGDSRFAVRNDLSGREQMPVPAYADAIGRDRFAILQCDTTPRRGSFDAPD